MSEDISPEFKVIPVNQRFSYPEAAESQEKKLDKRFTPDWYKVPVTKIIVEN